jgi:hypothetical protein
MSAMPLAETQKQILSKVPLFSGLAAVEIDFLAPRVMPRNFAPGQIVFNEGDPAPDCMLSLPAAYAFSKLL